MVGNLAYVITYAKFQDDIFRGCDFTGGRISHFPFAFCMGLIQQCSATALPVIAVLVPWLSVWPKFLANVNSSSCSLYVIDGPSVCLSVVCLSVTFVRPIQAIEIFGNISMPCGTLAIHDLCIKILRRSSQGNPSVGGVKHKKGSRI